MGWRRWRQAATIARRQLRHLWLCLLSFEECTSNCSTGELAVHVCHIASIQWIECCWWYCWYCASLSHCSVQKRPRPSSRPFFVLWGERWRNLESRGTDDETVDKALVLTPDAGISLVIVLAECVV
jgi:hypothetical protein